MNGFNFQGTMNIKNEKCILRNWKESDVPLLAVHANNKNIEMNLRDGFPIPYTSEDAAEFISSVLKSDPVTVFAIEVNGEAAGSIGYFPKSNIYKFNAEIGYWLSEKYWGQGIMTEAVASLTEYIFENTKLRRIYAEVFAKNSSSAKVLEKAGYTLEARIRNHIVKDGQMDDTLLYTIHKTDFENR